MVSWAKVARMLVKIGALFIVLMFVEYMVSRTFFSLIAFVVVIFPIFTIKFQNCRTPIYDHRIASYVKGFDPRVLDKCPVCGEKMLASQQKFTMARSAIVVC